MAKTLTRQAKREAITLLREMEKLLQATPLDGEQLVFKLAQLNALLEGANG